MYKQSFGTNGQIQFANEHEYYKFWRNGHLVG